MKILFLFAGQGYPNPDLFRLFQSDAAALAQWQLFCQHSPVDLNAINDPHCTQVIIGIYQLTLFSLVQPLCAAAQINLAGYSLGEVSAFLASSAASPQICLQTLNYRTQLMTPLMQEHYDLLSVTGTIHLDKIEKLCALHQSAIAIIPSNEHLVIGGRIAHLHTLTHDLQQQFNLRCKFLNIHLPSHTPFYAPIKGKFQHFLQQHFADSRLHYPLLSPLSLSKIYDLKDECALLDEELYTRLQWQKLCALMGEYQYDLLIDLGPSDAMTSIVSTVNPDLASVKIITAAHYSSMAGLYDAINKANNA